VDNSYMFLSTLIVLFWNILHLLHYSSHIMFVRITTTRFKTVKNQWTVTMSSANCAYIFKWRAVADHSYYEWKIMVWNINQVVWAPVAFQGRTRRIPGSISRWNNAWPMRMPLRMSWISRSLLVNRKPVRKPKKYIKFIYKEILISVMRKYVKI